MVNLMKKYGYLFFAFLSSILIYFPKLFFYSISIDTEAFLFDSHGIVYSWFSIGRWSLGLMKELVNCDFNVILANWFSLILMFFFAVIICFLFNRLLKKENKFINYIFIMLIMTSACFIEQYNFTLQTVEVSFCFLLEAIALVFVFLALKNRKIFYLIISSLLLIVSFGCYQAFLPLWITLSAISYYLYIKDKDLKLKEHLVNFLYFIIPFIVGFISYNIFASYFMNVKGIAITNYLSIKWFNSPITDVVYNVIKYIGAVIIGYGNDYNIFYLLFSLIFIYFNYKEFRKTRKVIILLVSLFILICPFILTMLIGDTTAARAQFPLIIVVPFLCYYIYSSGFLNNKYSTIYNIICILVLLSQSLVGFLLLYSDYNRYKNDVSLSYQIEELAKLANVKKLVFIGGFKNNRDVYITGETLGHSFFNWDVNEELGTNTRALVFMETLGMSYEIPSILEYNSICEMSYDLPVWPDSDSYFKFGDALVVKFSECNK